MVEFLRIVCDCYEDMKEKNFMLLVCFFYNLFVLKVINFVISEYEIGKCSCVFGKFSYIYW